MELGRGQRKGALPLGPNVGKFKSTLKIESAVAEAKRGDVAVIGPGGEGLTIAITNKDLRAFRPTKQAWKDSSEALKFLRDKLGEQGVVGQPTTHSIDITDTHLGGGLKVPVMLQDTDAKAAAPNSPKDLQEDEQNKEVEEDFLMKVVDTKLVKVPKEELMIWVRRTECRRKSMELWDKQDRGVPDEEEQGGGGGGG